MFLAWCTESPLNSAHYITPKCMLDWTCFIVSKKSTRQSRFVYTMTLQCLTGNNILLFIWKLGMVSDRDFEKLHSKSSSRPYLFKGMYLVNRERDWEIHKNALLMTGSYGYLCILHSGAHGITGCKQLKLKPLHEPHLLQFRNKLHFSARKKGSILIDNNSKSSFTNRNFWCIQHTADCTYIFASLFAQVILCNYTAEVETEMLNF